MRLPTNYEKLDWRERRAVREQYIEEQEGKCYWCKEPLDEKPPVRVTNNLIDWGYFPKGFLNHPIHLQHDHGTNMTEGAVHAYCNAVMWQYHKR